MGKTGESVNTTHQQKMGVEDLMYYRDRFDVPLTNKQVEEIQYFRPNENSEEIKYLKDRRIKLGGFIPERTTYAKQIKAPQKDIFDFLKESTGKRDVNNNGISEIINKSSKR